MTIAFDDAFPSGGGGNPLTQRVLVFVPASRTVLSPITGILRVRQMGAAGSGASGNSASGGNGATVAFKTVEVTKGDSIVVTNGAGGAASAANAAGNNGGTSTVTGPNGLSLSIPGGRAGVTSGLPVANANPTGADEFWLGGIGGSGGTNAGGGGGGAALLNGAASGFSGGNGTSSGAGGGGAGVGAAGVLASPGGSGGPSGLNMANVVSVTPAFASESHSRIFINVSAGTVTTNAGPGGGALGAPSGGSGAGQAGFGGGGGGSTTNVTGGAGGPGGGGGASGGTGGASGKGGDAYTVLEFIGEA